ncbi:MAG: hypothetical protein H0T46_25950 [Deltaproteobacteria bacterium]|nr:hypothetical protein [Deltaproteobacteria bacterium]
MRSALVSLLVLIGCGQPQPTGTDGSLGGDGMPGDDADVPTVDSPPNAACPNWCVENLAGVTSLLYGVAAVSPSEAFVVGDGGVILHRRDNAWTRMTSGTTQHLRGVWAASPTDVWAVGHAGTILRYNGTSWSAVTGVTTSDCVAVWGSGPSDVWVASSGRANHWNGSQWTYNSVTGTLLGLSGTGANDVWLATENGYLKHYTGTTWGTVMPAGGGAQTFAVLALPGVVWTGNITPGSETLRYNGTAWTPHGTSSTIFQSYFGTEANNVWAAGSAKVGHWTGTTWEITVPAGNTNNLWGVSGSGRDVYVVGSGGTILHHN